MYYVTKNQKNHATRKGKDSYYDDEKVDVVWFQKFNDLTLKKSWYDDDDDEKIRVCNSGMKTDKVAVMKL